MMDKLKPCPHCGKAKPLKFTTCEEIECENFRCCDNFGYVSVICDVHDGGCGASGGFAQTKQEAIEKWNQRAEPENKPLTLEELRQMDGQPVWIEDLENPLDSEWRLCYWNRGKYLALVAQQVKGHLLDEYGKMWLAYTHKPKEDKSVK